MSCIRHTEVETNKCCVFPQLRSSGALRGVVKAKRCGKTQHLLVFTSDVRNLRPHEKTEQAENIQEDDM